MIKKYKKKPVIIDAVQYIGSNLIEVEDFINQPVIRYDNNVLEPNNIGILTSGGIMKVSTGDYIIKEGLGECYSCNLDMFKLLYEEV